MAGAGANGNGAGSAGERTPMLLLHGFTGTPLMWEPVLPLLEQHHECHAIHLPGHHGGPPFTDPGENIVDSFSDRIEQQMDELGLEQAHIVGNSLGGWLALGIAGRGRALSTVAISPAAGWELHSAETARAQRLFKAIQFQLAHFKPLALEMAARPRGRKLVLRDAVARPSRLPGPLAVQWILAAADTPCWEMLLEHAGEFNVENTVDPFETPLRILWGSKDRILPFERYSSVHMRHLPHAEWITLDGLGHVPMSDDPELVARRILELTAVQASGVAGSD